METLSVEDVLSIHEALIIHFEEEGDPIVPSGVRSSALLESAISRQGTSIGGTFKYSAPHSNAAALMYGICMNHPFHNGNKRTALVATLVHLDRNGYIPDGVTHKEFYNMILALADHRLSSSTSTPRGGRNAVPLQPRQSLSPDQETNVIAQWLKRRTRHVDKREHPLTFRQLRRILGRHNCRFGNQDSGFIDVYKDEELIEKGFLGLGRPRKRRRETKVTQIAYAGEGELVKVMSIKLIRKKCKLLPEDGIDSRSFYDSKATIDYILNQYRTILKRLARV